MKCIHLYLVILLVLLNQNIINGQEQDIILSVAPPIWLSNRFQEEFFENFEANHPHVKVVLVTLDQSVYYPTAVADIEEHLQGAARYAEIADILYFSSLGLSPEITQAKYVLNLLPLFSADQDLGPTDFEENSLNTFVWDDGLWALPVSTSISVLAYRRDTFDALGLNYPNPSWTVEDINLLADRMAQQNIDIPSILAFEPALFLRAFYTFPFYEDSNSSTPNFSDSELIQLLEIWRDWTLEGIVSQDITSNVSYEDIPIRQVYLSDLEDLDLDNWGYTLFPGSTSGAQVNAFAVSAGTQYPELSYELAKYITDSLDIISLFNDDFPSRHNQSTDSSLYSDEIAEFRTNAIANAVPASELRHRNYLDYLLSRLMNGVDSEIAVIDTQNLLNSNTELAIQRQQDPINVTTYHPLPPLLPNEIEFNFGIFVPSSPLPNLRVWQDVVHDYVMNTPEVGRINLIINPQSFENYGVGIDCFYVPYNILTESDSDNLLNIEPLLRADADFDFNNVVVQTAVDQLGYDGGIYGYPITIQPDVLLYNQQAFSDFGLSFPNTNLTIDEFLITLYQLKEISLTEYAPFSPHTVTNTPLLMLIAAYGGLPFDYRTIPPTVNLTSEDTVNAIQAILDLAKENFIQYTPLDAQTAFFGNPSNNLIFSSSLSDTSYFVLTQATGFVPINYPIGRNYTPISYDLGSGYITASTEHREACYEWIKYAAKIEVLFFGLPIQINTSLQSRERTTYFQTYLELIQSNTLVVFPKQGRNIRYLPEHMWLNRVFNSYVLEDIDLVSSLGDAELFIREYRLCLENGMFNNVEPRSLEYGNCAQAVDPNLYDNPLQD